MALQIEREVAEEEEEEERETFNGTEPASHHPPAPSDELFDISTTIDPSYIISLIRKLIPDNVGSRGTSHGVGASDNHANGFASIKSEASESRDEVQDLMKNNEVERMDDDGDLNECVSEGGDHWEEYGCVLWDLAASRTHTELMVDNLILEVLLANLMVSPSVRVTEICLGIIGNLACHENPMKHIVSKEGLIEIILDQLFLDDTRCLCEACRLITSGLQSGEGNTWAKALQYEESEHILSRIMWIAENTLNAQLLEKSIALLSAIIEGEPESSCAVPCLMKLGLLSLLVNLFASEMRILTGERVPERYSVLDMILRTIEDISVLDDHTQEISSNKELFQLACELIKLSDKAEISNSCVTAAVLIANILSDVPDLASEISSDMLFLHGLFDLFPFASEDLEARIALWSIIARLLVLVKEKEIAQSNLCQYVSVLASKYDLIEDDLLDQRLDPVGGDEASLGSSRPPYMHSRCSAVCRIISILDHWTAAEDCRKLDDHMEENSADYQNVSRLLNCCRKHIE